MRYKSSCYTLKNNVFEDKPNEDAFFADDNKNIYAVFDGVSRDRKNQVYPNPSPAKKITLIISKYIYRKMMSVGELTDLKLNKIIRKANRIACIYNVLHYTSVGKFKAGTVGVICYIKGNILNYVYIGDCSAYVVSKTGFLKITKKQTDNLLVNKGKYNKDEIRFNICNNIQHPCGYGVINGSSKAMDFLIFGKIELKEDDVIFLSSDGCDNVFHETNINDLNSKSAKELIEAFCMGKMQDDRTLVSVKLEALE